LDHHWIISSVWLHRHMAMGTYLNVWPCFATIPNEQWDGCGNYPIITIGILLAQIKLLEIILCA
jgi:hypothetical protein